MFTVFIWLCLAVLCCVIAKEKNNFEEMSLEEHYLYYEKKGMDKKEIIKQIAKDKNTNKNEIYQKFLKK